MYIFEYNGSIWEEKTKIVSNDGNDGDNFGFSISLSTDSILIGAPFNDRSGVPLEVDSGAAYIYDYDNNDGSWQQTIKLTPASDVGGLFGNSVSFSEDKAVIGAPNDGLLSGEPGGSTYIFDFNGSSWTFGDKLKPSDVIDVIGLFGYSVSHSENQIIIGDYIRSRAYIFEKQLNSWVETEIITQSGDSLFGFSVKIAGDVALIGEPNHDNVTGRAILYKRNGNDWIQSQVLTASDGIDGDLYGYSVDFDGTKAIISASEGNSNDPSRPAAAYIYGPDIVFNSGFESL